MPSAVAAAFMHTLMFHYAYVRFIHPMFEYAHYLYFAPSMAQLAYCYTCVIAPILAYRPSLAPANLGASIIYAIGYVPAQLMMLFMWQGEPGELIFVHLALTVSMTAMFTVARFGYTEGIALPERLTPPFTILTIVIIAAIAIMYRDHLRIVSFAEVYDLRFETNEIVQNSFVAYLQTWLPYLFLPFHMARWLLARQRSDLALALAASVIMYVSTGSKASLLTPAIMLGIHSVLSAGDNVLRALLVRLAALQAFVTVVIPDNDAWLWAKSIVFMRVLGTSGWNTSVYYDYFTERGYTYYTHIGPVKAVTDAYPFGDLSLGQLIGVEYSGTSDANFNANFWASDGFAALGLGGIPIVTVMMCLVLLALNRTSAGLSPRFVNLWLAGFWLAVLNHPLTTALLTAGGGLAMAAMWLVGKPSELRGVASPEKSAQ